MAKLHSLQELINSRRASSALAAHYEAAVKRIVRELAAGATKAQAFRANALLTRIRALLKDLDPKAAGEVQKWIQREIPKAFVIRDKAMTKELQAALRGAPASAQGKFRTIDPTWTPINAASMRGVVAAMESTLGNARDEMERALGAVIRQTKTSLERAARIRGATAQGFLRGSTVQQVGDDIASILLGKSISPAVRARLEATGFNAKLFNDFEAVARGQLIKVGKRTYTVRSYSTLVARAQFAEVSRISGRVRMLQNNVTHIQITTHAQDHPDECTPFAGRVFYIGEGSDPRGFPSARSLPNGGIPFHPYCRHRERSYDVLLKGDAQIHGDRAAAREVSPFLGTDARGVRDRVRGLDPASFRRIATQGESQKEAS